MSSAIEVLKKYSTSCSVCKYDGGNQCKASGGEFGECKPAEELSKAINKAIVALEKLERVKEITEHWESWYELDENGTGLEDLVDDLKDILNTKKVGEQK